MIKKNSSLFRYNMAHLADLFRVETIQEFLQESNFVTKIILNVATSLTESWINEAFSTPHHSFFVWYSRPLFTKEDVCNEDGFVAFAVTDLRKEFYEIDTLCAKPGFGARVFRDLLKVFAVGWEWPILLKSVPSALFFWYKMGFRFEKNPSLFDSYRERLIDNFMRACEMQSLVNNDFKEHLGVIFDPRNFITEKAEETRFGPFWESKNLKSDQKLFGGLADAVSIYYDDTTGCFPMYFHQEKPNTEPEIRTTPPKKQKFDIVFKQWCSKCGNPATHRDPVTSNLYCSINCYRQHIRF